MKFFWQKFWAWYDRYYKQNAILAAGLFSLQLVHLYWLTTEVVAFRLFGQSFFFTDNALFEALLVLVDYTEIPAIVLTSLFYVNAFRRDGKWRDILYLFFINSQWFHILWITDEVVIHMWHADANILDLPPLLAWAAILIDYLELPVIYETIREAVRSRSLRPLSEKD